MRYTHKISKTAFKHIFPYLFAQSSNTALMFHMYLVGGKIATKAFIFCSFTTAFPSWQRLKL